MQKSKIFYDDLIFFFKRDSLLSVPVAPPPHMHPIHSNYTWDGAAHIPFQGHEIRT